jgi:hypothetical protein
MNKEFVPYELALRLKELGYDEPCFGSYYNDSVENFKDGKFDYRRKLNIEYSIYSENTYYILAPTYSQAFRWFREKYHIIGEVKFKGGKTTKTAWYDYIIYSEIDWDDKNPNEQWKKYEEAELECLKKLIEIVESNLVSNQLYSEIETLIMMWNNDGTKTAGSLTRDIMKVINQNELL